MTLLPRGFGRIGFVVLAVAALLLAVRHGRDAPVDATIGQHWPGGGGGPRLVNLFASWCVPCAAEMPQLAALAHAGVRVEGVAVRDTSDDTARFLVRHGNPYAQVFADPTGRVQTALGSSGLPESYVIDAAGVIRYHHRGDIRPEDVPALRQAVDRAR